MGNLLEVHRDELMAVREAALFGQYQGVLRNLAGPTIVDLVSRVLAFDTERTEREKSTTGKPRDSVGELRAALLPFSQQVVKDDSICHAGICLTGECSRCGPILHAREVLK